MGKLVDELKQAQEQESLDARAASAAAYELEQAQRRLAEAKRNGYKTEAKRAEEVETLSEALSEARATHERSGMRLDVAAKALEDVRAARWEQRLAELRELVVGSEQLQLTMDARSNYGSWSAGRWELRQMREQDGVLKQVFGHDVTVYGPEQRQDWNRETREPQMRWENASVNWGSMGSMGVTQAQELLRVHSLAILLAVELDARRDEWVTEDQAD